MEVEHRVLNILEHLWPYVSGLVLIMGATMKLWWHGRREIKKRIVVLEKLAENGASQDDLRDCRAGVDEQDAENLKIVLGEIKELRGEIRQDTKESVEARKQDTKENVEAHSKIMDKVMELNKS
jgi:hypothetical protein